MTVQHTRGEDRFLWRALAASLGLHVLLALFLPVWTVRISQGLQPVEAVSFARITSIELQRPAEHALPAAIPHTRHRAPKASFARTKAEISARRPKARPRVLHHAHVSTGKTAAAPKRVARSHAPVYVQATASTQAAVVQAPPAPTPQPEVTEAPRAANGRGEADRGGLLPFGATQNPVLDPSVRLQLEKRFGVHVTLLVTVDENGHTQHVAFSPQLDPATERAIEALLADATWDAAVCGGGVTCAGTARIKL